MVTNPGLIAYESTKFFSGSALGNSGKNCKQKDLVELGWIHPKSVEICMKTICLWSANLTAAHQYQRGSNLRRKRK